MTSKSILSKSLPLASLVLPYYGFVDECCSVMLKLCKRSRKLWQCNEEILIRIIQNLRTLKVDYLNQDILIQVNLNSLKYYLVETELTEQFLTVITERYQRLRSSFMINSENCQNSNLAMMKRRTTGEVCNFVVNYSKCPDYVHINGKTFNLNETAEISQYVLSLKGEEEKSPLLHIMTKSGSNRSPITEYIPEFTLVDTANLMMFHNFKRRCIQLENALANFQKIDPMWDKTPFIESIGVLKVEVKSISFLKFFFNTCDTKVKELRIIGTPPITKDIFQFKEELSKTLSTSVEKIITNKWFEKSCRRFDNCDTFEVQNFPAIVDILTRQGKQTKNIKYTSGLMNSTVTIKNSFVSLNKIDSAPFFCESITAHFSKEDFTVEGEGSYFKVGGPMIELKGISHEVKSQDLTKLMNSMKNESSTSDHLIVLALSSSTSELLMPFYKNLGFAKQIFYVNTSSKYVDLKIKKANCGIELNSDSDHSLVYDKNNEKFIQFLKVFLQGRCNLSSAKVAQALSLHIVDSLHFEIQKYSDSAKLLEEMDTRFPSSIKKFTIEYSNDICLSIEEEKELSADVLLKKWVREYPNLELTVNSPKTASSKRLYYLPIMRACYIDESAAQIRRR